MKMAAGRKSRAGFTITEVVVAVFILAIFMAGVYQVMNSAMRLRQVVRDHYVAALLANNRIERAKTYKYKDLYLLAEDKVVIDDFGTPYPDGYFRCTTVVNTNYANRLTKVDVTVEMKDRIKARFLGAVETVSTLLTEYVDPLNPN